MCLSNFQSQYRGWSDMSRLNISWVLCVVLVGHSWGLMEHFVHDSISTWCNRDEILENGSCGPKSSCKCQNVDKQLLHVLTKDSGVFKDFLRNVTELVTCVDVLKSGETNKKEVARIIAGTSDTHFGCYAFPKCCPVDAKYDMHEHKCVKVHNTNSVKSSEINVRSYSNKTTLYLKIGLTNCEHIIADFTYPLLNDIVLNEDMGIFIYDLKQNISFGNYCIDEVFNNETYVVRVCHADFNMCKKNISDQAKVRCIRKCCKDGYMYKNSNNCTFDFEHGLHFSTSKDSVVPNPKDPFAIIQQRRCRDYLEDSIPYWVDEAGYLHLENNSGSFSPFETGYCLEEVDVDGIKGLNLFLCLEDELDREKLEFKIKRVTLSLSCIFLALTVVGYLFVPEMQNLHGKILMSYCCAMLTANLVLVVALFQPTPEDVVCIRIGYLILYTSLSSFMWLNVMCFDMWRTFVSIRVQGLHERKRQLRRFLWYSFYAWDTPAVITIVAFLMQHYGNYFPASLKPIIPRIGEFKCFFEQQTNMAAYAIWFICPIALICVCDFVLFIKTSIYFYKVKNDVEKMKDMQQLTKRLKTIAKLFLVMGVSWIFECVSGCAISSKAGEALKVMSLIMDTFNSLQGVFIFGIFILNENFINTLKKRLGVNFPRRSSSQSTTSATKC